MRTLRLLGRDMENGILRRCVLFILPLLFAVSQTRELHAYLIELADGNILLTNGTFADYLLFAMKGMEVYYFDPRSVFYIPIYWFAFQIGLAYFLAYYSSDDFAANARVVCLASGSRRSWWVSKLDILYGGCGNVFCCMCADDIFNGGGIWGRYDHGYDGGADNTAVSSADIQS